MSKGKYGLGASRSSEQQQQQQQQQQTVNASGTSATTKQLTEQERAALTTAEGNLGNVNAVISQVGQIGAATVQNALMGSVPQTQSAAKHAGGYNSTTADMLTGYNAAQAQAQGTIAAGQAYGNIMGANAGAVNAVAQASQVTAGQTVATTGASNTVGSTSTNTNNNTRSADAKAGTVICTQLWLDGHMSDAVYYADNKYVRKHFSRHTVNGYQFWAVPFVYAMRKYSAVYSFGKWFGLAWSHHCASKYCPEAKPNKLGWTLVTFIAPICFLIGACIPNVEYWKLWKGSY